MVALSDVPLPEGTGMTASAKPRSALAYQREDFSRPPRGLDVRLARTAREVDAAQALRYRVFYEEMGARAAPAVLAARRDRDRFDAHCDHLIIVDHAGAEGAVIGPYRLLRREGAARLGGFYTETEFDIAKLVNQPGEILELGRSCVDPAYRTRAVMQHLWRGI